MPKKQELHIVQPRARARSEDGVCLQRLFVCLLLLSGLITAAAEPLMLSPREVEDDAPSEPVQINPPSNHKFKTLPELGMPGNVDFSPLAKNNISSYDDETGTMIINGSKLNRSLEEMYQARHGHGNGYISAEVSFFGPFFEMDRNQTHANGTVRQTWPIHNARQAFSGVSGFYNCQDEDMGSNYPELKSRGCESVISGTPYPYGLHLEVEGQMLNASVNPSTITNYTQTLDFRSGLAKWDYVWSPNGTDHIFHIEYTALASRVRHNVAAVQMRVTPRKGNTTARLVDKLDGRSAVRSELVNKGVIDDSTIYVQNHAVQRPSMTAWTVSKVDIPSNEPVSRQAVPFINDNSTMSIGQSWDVDLIGNETVTFTKYVGIAAANHYEDLEQTARNALTTAYEDGWDQIIAEHTQAWNAIMHPRYIPSYRDPATGVLSKDDIMLNLFQASTTADRYYLFQNLLPDDGTGLNTDGLTIGGIASDSYAGLVFWDQESWMYPGLALTSPDYAVQLINYRLKFFEQAKLNAQEDYVQEHYNFNNKSALYPWTSGGYGNATATGPVIDYEYHLGADIAIMMFAHRQITGDEKLFREKLFPVIDGIANALTTLLQWDGASWFLRNMTDPDEFANHIDNGAFTQASISKMLTLINEYQKDHNMPVNETWVDMAKNIRIPRAPSGITKEYESMLNNVKVKQADVTLLNQLDLDDSVYNLTTARMDAAYYAVMEDPAGPAMTRAIDSINELQIGTSGTAGWSLDVAARISNLRAPWLQMSEQLVDDVNNNGGYPPAFPFLTGHGANNMIVPLGYLGINMLAPVLTVRPTLPIEIQHLQVPDFYFKGNRIQAVLNTTHTSLTRLPPVNVTGVFDAYPNKTMPFIVRSRSPNATFISSNEYSFAMNETVVVPNDMYWQTITTKSNILQNRQTLSFDEEHHVFAGAATDGNPITRWIAPSNESSFLIVNTEHEQGKLVKEVRMDWGERHPTFTRVTFTNASLTSGSPNETAIMGGRSFNASHIRPSVPYDPQMDTVETVPYVGNSTSIVFDSDDDVRVARFVVLEVEGCEGEMCEEGGTTVGEFEVIVDE